MISFRIKVHFARAPVSVIALLELCVFVCHLGWNSVENGPAFRNMSHNRICSFKCSLVGLIAIILYFVDRTLAQLESYVPDEDYPIYTEVPLGLSFTCDDKIPGYYADPEARCQVWHWCVPGIGGNEKYSFICAPGTVFNQRTRVCDYFYKVDCPNAAAFYGINEDLYKDEAGNYINGKK